jgi:hypothetical protein
MRASHQEQTGGAGISEVSAAFERIGWGTVENSRHDLGTDLFMLARDERGFELGLLVGAQVKAGDSYFREPVNTKDGDSAGWWFRDRDRSHVDGWAEHGVPHLIVLHDLNTRTSYWAHVTKDAIVSTGKGAKILVPKENTVDAEHREELLAVAATLRAGAGWQGSVWNGSASIAPEDQWRHALIVPRLVAPHPNAGVDESLTPPQALAMLIQARIREYVQFAEKQDGFPLLSDAPESEEWGWRFVGALGRRLNHGDIEALPKVVADAPDASSRAAAAVAAACALLDDGRIDEAVELLEETLAGDEAGPVDHAWLSVQHARLCAETGRVAEARQAAIAVQQVRARAGSDVTATAVAGAAAALLFNTSSWEQRDVKEVITAGDTAAAWWRSQTVVRGLDALVDRTFSDWARDESVTVGAGDVVNNQLISASLIANHGADHGGWRHLSGLLGRDQLLRLDREADAELARDGLATLRRAGDKAAVKLAVKNLVADGPAAALTLIANDVQLDKSTRTSGLTDLTLLQLGGDLIEREVADKVVTWLLAGLEDPTSFQQRTSPSYVVGIQFVETLAGVLPAASSPVQQSVVEFLLAFPALEDQAWATAWARVVHAVPDDIWTAEVAQSLGEVADEHNFVLQFTLLGIAARYDEDVKDRLKEEAEGGSLRALEQLGNVTDLPTSVVQGMIETLAKQVEGQIEEAHSGRFGLGSDIGRELALLNIWHLDVAQWNPLLNLLGDPAVAAEHKKGAIKLLGQVAERLPTEVKERLGPIAVDIAEQSEPVLTPFDDGQDLVGTSVRLAMALGAFAPEEEIDRLLDLLAGNADERRWAAHVISSIGRAEDTRLLVALTQDRDPNVRAVSAGALAQLVARGQEDNLIEAAFQRCLLDPGTWVPSNIAGTLSSEPELSPVAERALHHLRGHASAQVRLLAGEVAADRTAGSAKS